MKIKIRMLEELEHKEIGGQIDVGTCDAEASAQQQILAGGGGVRQQDDRKTVK